MKLKRLRQDDVEINLISLIDVLLFLVIFFMVSTTFVAKSQLSLTLPEAVTNEESDRDKAIEVTLDADGHCECKRRAFGRCRSCHDRASAWQSRERHE